MNNKLVKASINVMIKLAVQKDEDDDDDDDDYDDDDEEENKTKSDENKTEEKKDDEKKEDEKKDDEKKDEKKKENKYNKFFENYGKNIKLRVIEDIQNRNKVANLLRFYSTKDLMIYKF